MSAVDQAGGQWKFTPEVAASFDKHVASSVPFYKDIQDIVARISDWSLPDGSTFADLGASTGTTAAAIHTRHPNRDLTFVLYDEQQAMLDQAAAKLEAAGAACYELRCQDITREPQRHHEAGLTTALFTLQFLPISGRLRALKAARDLAAPGGVLVVAEKVALPDGRWHEMAAELSWDKKLEAGHSAEHVVVKAASLRGVLRPLSDDANRRLISGAGWESVEILFRWQQWAVYGAFAGKPGDDLGVSYGVE